MSSVTSYTLLSRPAPLGKISSTPKQAHKLRAASAVAFPLVGRKLSSLTVCHATPYEYNVPPIALVHPKFPESSSSIPNKNWKIEEEADHINLWFKVGEETSKEDLQVAIKGNLLLISYKEKKDEDKTSPPPSSPALASKLDVRLLLPSGYEDDDPKKKVKAELTLGSMLKVTVTKPDLPPNVITIIGPSGQA